VPQVFSKRRSSGRRCPCFVQPAGPLLLADRHVIGAAARLTAVMATKDFVVFDSDSDVVEPMAAQAGGAVDYGAVLEQLRRAGPRRDPYTGARLGGRQGWVFLTTTGREF